MWITVLHNQLSNLPKFPPSKTFRTSLNITLLQSFPFPTYFYLICRQWPRRKTLYLFHHLETVGKFIVADRRIWYKLSCNLQVLESWVLQKKIWKQPYIHSDYSIYWASYPLVWHSDVFLHHFFSHELLHAHDLFYCICVI